MFDNYFIEEINLKVNSNIKKQMTFNLSPKFTIDFTIADKELKCVLKMIITKTKEDDVMPFEISITMQAEFDILEMGAPSEIRAEAATFLYPYLRNIVSSVTGVSNITPYFLPPVDFAASFKSPPTSKPTDPPGIVIRLPEEDNN
jgi:preprotein translocase subunit SecB